MQVIAVRPGQAHSIHLRRVRRPRIDDIPAGRGVLVRVLRVGLCGTDAEIAEGLFGSPPPGADHLVLGHENLGQVVEVGPAVPHPYLPGQLVVATVRREGTSFYDRIGQPDMTTDDPPLEPGINRVHGYLAELIVEDPAWLVPLPAALSEVGVLTEPMSIAQKAVRQGFEAQRRLKVWRPVRAAIIGAGPIGLLAAVALRLRGLEVTCFSRRPAPYRNSDLVERLGARYVSAASTDLATVAADHGPFDLVIEASGAARMVIEAAMAVGPNGVLVLTSVTGGSAVVEVDVARLNQAFVLRNQAVVGIVNSGHEDFLTAVADMARAQVQFPGWLGSLLTTRIDGLDPVAIARQLAHRGDAIKAWVEIAPPV